jgi:hypothetical protein
MAGEYEYYALVCSVEQWGSDLNLSFFALALALFNCKGGLKENYKFFIIFLARELLPFYTTKILPALRGTFGSIV